MPYGLSILRNPNADNKGNVFSSKANFITQI
jgi:hypothetical protein